MKKIPTHWIVFGSAMLLVTLAGGVTWWWTADQLEAARREQRRKVNELGRLGGNFLPNEQNTAILRANLQAKDAIRKQGVDLMIQASRPLATLSVDPEEKGRPIGDVENAEWKAVLTEIRRQLRERATQAGVDLQSNWLGFIAYEREVPRRQAVPKLSIQLQAVQALVSALIDARVASIESVKRALFEIDSRPGATPNTGPDGVFAFNLENVNGLYDLYPFEIDFEASVPSMFEAVNRIQSQKLFFIIRNMVIRNPKATLPDRGTLRDSAEREAQGSGFGNDFGTLKQPARPFFVPVVGLERLKVTLRVDLVVWRSSLEPTSTEGEGLTQ